MSTPIVRTDVEMHATAGRVAEADRLREENAQLRHAVQTWANRVSAADDYLLTAPDDTDVDVLRREVRALLSGTAN